LLEALLPAVLSLSLTGSRRSRFGMLLRVERLAYLGVPANWLRRLQLQGELQSKKEATRLYKGVFHGVGVIVKNEGVRGLLRGLSCAVGHLRNRPSKAPFG
jgi:hypothetical protein